MHGAVIILLAIIISITLVNITTNIFGKYEGFQKFVDFRTWGNPLVRTKGVREYQFGPGVPKNIMNLSKIQVNDRGLDSEVYTNKLEQFRQDRMRIPGSI